ncbi:KIF3A [Symbiodinium sp. CCMP2592]|nr:KIF3A [Symbiodinium sp. CCMP2592]
MVIEGPLKDKLEALKFKPTSRRTGKPLVGTAAPASGTQPAAALPTSPTRPGGGSLAVHVSVRCRPTVSSKQTVDINSESLGGDKVALKLTVPKSGNEGEDDKTRVDARTYRCNTYYCPTASHEEVASTTASLVQHAMEGGNGSILCHGITGSGKTHTMCGSSSSPGIVQSVGRRMFEHIRDQVASGRVYMVEASHVQIFSHDGSTEQLIDLLADVEKDLEVKQDPRNPLSYVCAGLQRIPIRSPDDLQQVINKGRARSQAKEDAGIAAARSHCMFILTVESMSEQSANGDSGVSKGKLVLVDLAGSESLLKTSSSDVARRQALGINRTLASLSMAVNSTSGTSAVKGSFLTQLLRDCMGGSSRTLVIATIGLELEDMEETVKTLTYAQQMMTSLTVRTSNAGLNRIDQDQSSLMQMRDRHNECIRMLKEKVSDSREEEQEERRRLQHEMNEINQRLLTKDSAEQTLEEMRQQQFSKMDAMRTEISEAMNNQMELLRKQSQVELESLRASVEKSQQESERVKKEAEAHEAAVVKLQATLQDAQQARRAAEDEASSLKVKLATAEERASMLSTRQEELRKERAEFDEERKQLRQQGEQQWQRLAVVEAELSKFKSEAEVQKKEIERLNAARAEENEGIRSERESWRCRERDLQAEVASFRSKLEETKREAEVQELKVSRDHGDALSKLKLQIERLETEASSRSQQLSEAKEAVANLEADRAIAQQREDQLRQQAAAEIKRWQVELETSRAAEAELMKMLDEVQDGIIQTNAGAQPDIS